MDEEKPDYYDQRQSSYGHTVRAIEGRFHDLVWKCVWCGKTASKLDVYRKLDCE
jgi:hypothetical protein